MLTEVLTIGDELCRGEIVDTNSAWIAEKLWDLDITVAWMTSCRDLRDDIAQAISSAVGRAELVVISGGLGPTEDDITVDVLAELAGAAAVIDEPSRARMEERFAQAHFRLTPNNLRQVRVVEGARVFANPVGLAPGFEVAVGGVPVICLPGVPRELHGIYDRWLGDRLVELREGAGEVERIARRIYRVFGRGESHIGAALTGLTQGVEGASLHFQTKFPENLVKLVVRDRDGEKARERLEALDGKVRETLGRALYGIDDDSLPAALGRILRAAGLTLATAESCTGGLVGGLLTAVPGASDYFLGGCVTYTNAEKIRQLGVEPATLAEHGAVSEECVTEMAGGCRLHSGADLAVAVSGIAGPDGGTPDKPVGTVWIAVAGPAGRGIGLAPHAPGSSQPSGPRALTKRFMWPGTRDQVRTMAAYWAIEMVRRLALSMENDSDA